MTKQADLIHCHSTISTHQMYTKKLSKPTVQSCLPQSFLSSCLLVKQIHSECEINSTPITHRYKRKSSSNSHQKKEEICLKNCTVQKSKSSGRQSYTVGFGSMCNLNDSLGKRGGGGGGRALEGK